MLVVKVELHPYGDPSNVKTLAAMIIANDGTSKDPKFGDYKVYSIDKFGNRTLKARVKNHRRLRDSVWKLVSKAINTGKF